MTTDVQMTCTRCEDEITIEVGSAILRTEVDFPE